MCIRFLVAPSVALSLTDSSSDSVLVDRNQLTLELSHMEGIYKVDQPNAFSAQFLQLGALCMADLKLKDLHYDQKNTPTAVASL